jgi:hypothetical protein
MPDVRFMHGSPGNSRFDVYTGGRRVASNLGYGRHSDYHNMPEGDHDYTLYPAGRRFRPIARSRVVIGPVNRYTVAVSGYSRRVVLLPLPDIVEVAAPGMAYIKFVHLSPNAPNFDIILPDGTVLFSNIGYNGRTAYVPLSPGNYTLQVVAAGTGQVLTTVTANLSSGATYTVYSLGLTGSISNPLRASVSLDGAEQY